MCKYCSRSSTSISSKIIALKSYGILKIGPFVPSCRIVTATTTTPLTALGETHDPDIILPHLQIPDPPGEVAVVLWQHAARGGDRHLRRGHQDTRPSHRRGQLVRQRVELERGVILDLLSRLM